MNANYQSVKLEVLIVVKALAVAHRDCAELHALTARAIKASVLVNRGIGPEGGVEAFNFKCGVDNTFPSCTWVGFNQREDAMHA